jgi:hypothetical protein
MNTYANKMLKYGDGKELEMKEANKLVGKLFPGLPQKDYNKKNISLLVEIMKEAHGIKSKKLEQLKKK